MSKHTPGPWAPATGGLGVNGQPGRFVRTTDADVVIHVSGPMAQARANARLIAAGPELYEAVHDLLSICECIEEIDERVHTGMIRARAALAKVEGKE